jgi:Uri superfamily endonuclease
VCFSIEEKLTECGWAEKAAGTPFPPRFGASDCGCAGHLVRLSSSHSKKMYPPFNDVDQTLQCLEIS